MGWIRSEANTVRMNYTSYYGALFRSTILRYVLSPALHAELRRSLPKHYLSVGLLLCMEYCAAVLLTAARSFQKGLFPALHVKLQRSLFLKSLCRIIITLSYKRINLHL